MRKGQQMKSLEEEITRIDAEIARLRDRRAAFVDALAMVSGMSSPVADEAPVPRRRAANVKPIILDIMWQAGSGGATSAAVAELVKEKVPAVAKDTVGSVLSRLKADGALIYDGERYYDKRFPPVMKEANPFEGGLRAVN